MTPLHYIRFATEYAQLYTFCVLCGFKMRIKVNLINLMPDLLCNNR